MTEGTATAEAVNHPEYYGGAENPYEAIKVIENWQLGFCLGNTVKYISRAGKKSDALLQDLKKAAWYLNREIETRSGESKAPPEVSYADYRLKFTRTEDRVSGFIKPDTDEQVFFYEQDFYVLSNFSAFDLHWNGYRFQTTEHAYHWMKFEGTPHVDIQQAIKDAPSAHEAFKIAERNKHLRRDDWDKIKVDRMRWLLKAKVTQHEYVARKLLATGERELIEDSWRDGFWGWGHDRTGINMLGKLWMEIRKELQQERRKE